jgi:hypothetical protein
MRKIKSSVENCTGRHWDLPSPPDYEEKDHHAPVGYDFMIYLRHNGFPSPLLDWTKSPYIAAFFAFNKKAEAKDIAIFSYVEDIGYGKSWKGDSPKIFSLGPYVTAHKRHYLQQCEYTICTLERENKLFYSDHEIVIAQNDPDQNLLEKYILPSSEGPGVLKILDSMNINGYSLFDNEEGLMSALSAREFIINEI